MINRGLFYANARSIIPKFTSGQVDGLNRILDEWDRRQLTDYRWLANMIAQSYWESAHTWQPIREMGPEAYLQSKPYYPWVGEGLIQVTWEANARKFGATEPGDLLNWPKALTALFDGMIKGMFTNKKLTDYFNDKIDDPLNARRIVNGTDHASDIAALHRRWLGVIEKSLVTTTAAPPVVVTKPALPIVVQSPAVPVKNTDSWLVRVLKAIFKRG